MLSSNMHEARSSEISIIRDELGRGCLELRKSSDCTDYDIVLRTISLVLLCFSASSLSNFSYT